MPRSSAPQPTTHWQQVRRRLHGIPELGLHLPRTQAVILEELAPFDLEVTVGTALSSVVAVLRGEAPVAAGRVRPVVLLRADMDALPVTEDSGEDFAPDPPGCMHACGHDLHVAGLLAAAELLHARRAELVGDVVLMFQPGEEGPGGAQPMIEEGLLLAAGRPVDVAYAVHVFAAEHPFGVWFGRPGTLMAGSDEVTIRVHGAGGHGAQPHRTLDPVPVACEIVLALQTMVTRRYFQFDPVVVTVGRIEAGTKHNIISDEAVLDLTVRTFSAEHRAQVKPDIERLASGVAGAHGLTASCVWEPGYPPTVNDPVEQAFAEDVIRDLFGEGRWRDQEHPEAGAEDFSFVLHQVPGAYLNVSACPPGVDPREVPDNHSARARFDDAIVPEIASFLAELALRRSATWPQGR